MTAAFSCGRESAADFGALLRRMWDSRTGYPQLRYFRSCWFPRLAVYLVRPMENQSAPGVL
jgi:hypothetical protein